MMSIQMLKGAADTLERLLCCDELNRTEQEHLSFALAHIREAGREAEEGTGRTPARLQDDLWEERRKQANAGLKHAWAVAGWPQELNPGGGTR